MHRRSFPRRIADLHRAALLLLVPAIASAPLGAQSVRGVVADVRTSDRIAGAAVLLLDSSGIIVGSTSSDSTGAFTIRAPEPGPHRLVTWRNGFLEAESDLLGLMTGFVVELRVNLVRPPFYELAPIEVVANDVPQSALFRQLLRRRELNVGYAFDLEDIERINPMRVQDLLRFTPGVRMFGRGFDQWAALNHNRCPPVIAIDGRQLSREFTEHFPMDWVIAVEVFRNRTEVPPEYRSRTGGPVGPRGDRFCGVVLMWTDRIR